MKLAQRQQGVGMKKRHTGGSVGKTEALGRKPEHVEYDGDMSSASLAVAPRDTESDADYRGKSDGEILARYEF